MWNLIISVFVSVIENAAANLCFEKLKKSFEN